MILSIKELQALAKATANFSDDSEIEFRMLPKPNQLSVNVVDKVSGYRTAVIYWDAENEVWILA